MKFTDYLFREAEPIWSEYINHQFLKELGEGTLEREKFKNYLIEDYLYLKEYTKVFAIAMTKSKSIKEIKFYYETIKGILEDENAVHIKYLKEFGVDIEKLDELKCSNVNSNYTSYMLKVALEGGIKEIVAVTMPCTWSYFYIGNKLSKIYGENLSENYYRAWIESYSSKEYKILVDNWIKYIDNMNINLESRVANELLYIFKKASMYEMEFWNMAYGEKIDNLN